MMSIRTQCAGALAFALALPFLASGEPSMGETAEMEAAAAAPSEISRRTFTSAVVEREPLDELRSIPEGTESVAYFTELQNMSGETVIHRWEYDGQVMGEVAFDVGGPRWRVHSTKKLDPSWSGAWTVKVLDAQGQVLSEEQIDYNTAIAATELEPEEPPVAVEPSLPAAPAPPQDE